MEFVNFGAVLGTCRFEPPTGPPQDIQLGLKELAATLRLKDNELKVANFNIFNGDDYVRGQGVVNKHQLQ